MSCADFVSVDEVYRPALVYRVAGVDKLGVKQNGHDGRRHRLPVGEAVAQERRTDPRTRFMPKVNP